MQAVWINLSKKRWSINFDFQVAPGIWTSVESSRGYTPTPPTPLCMTYTIEHTLPVHTHTHTHTPHIHTRSERTRSEHAYLCHCLCHSYTHHIIHWHTHIALTHRHHIIHHCSSFIDTLHRIARCHHIALRIAHRHRITHWPSSSRIIIALTHRIALRIASSFVHRIALHHRIYYCSSSLCIAYRIVYRIASHWLSHWLSHCLMTIASSHRIVITHCVSHHR